MYGRKCDWHGDTWHSSLVIVLITRAIALITRCIDSDAHHWLAVAHRHLTGAHRHLTGAHRHLTGAHRHLTGTHCHLTGTHSHVGLLLLTQHLIFAVKLFNLLVLLLDLTQKLVFTTEFLNLILLSRCLMIGYLFRTSRGCESTNRCFLIIEWARVPSFLVLFFNTFHLSLCIFFDTFV